MPLTATQLKERSSGIGGSDAAAALGISPWKTPLALWREKKGLDLPEDIADEPAVEWGNLLEDVVAAKFARDAGLRVQRVNSTLVSPAHPFMLANIDRAVVNEQIARRVAWNGQRLTTDQLLEVKTTNWRAADQWGEEGTDQVPLHYAAQAVHYLIVTGAELCHFGVLVDGRHFKRYKIGRDPQLVEMVIEGEREFWRMVESDTPPPITTPEDILLRYAADNGTAVEATQEIVETVAQYIAEKATRKQLEESLEALGNAIRVYMGDAATLTHKGKIVATWNTAKASRKFDEKTFAKEHPLLWEKYRRSVAGSRRLLTKGNI